MDSLREAADKIKKSPRLVRKKINNVLHKERLTEDWIHNREQVELGVVFNIKVLGRHDATEPQGKGCTDKVVEELVQKNKSNAKTQKLQKVSMMIDCDKMIIRDLLTHELIDDIPVKRICFCTSHQIYEKVFAFMVLGCEEYEAFIYAFLTNKKAMADVIALTVAQAYTMAYEEDEEKEVESNTQHQIKSHQHNINELEKTLSVSLSIPTITNVNDSDEDDDFLILAKSRKELTIGQNLDVTDFLAVNNTFMDLDRAKSHDDLFDSFDPNATNRRSSPVISPVLSGRSSPLTTTPQHQQNTGDLIQF